MGIQKIVSSMINGKGKRVGHVPLRLVYVVRAHDLTTSPSTSRSLFGPSGVRCWQLLGEIAIVGWECHQKRSQLKQWYAYDCIVFPKTFFARCEGGKCASMPAFVAIICKKAAI